MTRTTIHISVPANVRQFVEQRVAASGYGSVSEYFRELLREDRRRHAVQLNMQNRTVRAPANAPALTPERVFKPLASAARRPR